MFACGSCNVTVSPRQPANKIVTDKRLKTYEKLIRRGPNRGLNEEVEGWEIVKEINACPECFVAMTGQEPRLAAPVAPKKKPVQEDRRGFGYNRNKKPWQNRQQEGRPNNAQNQQRTDGPRPSGGGQRPWQDNRRPQQQSIRGNNNVQAGGNVTTTTRQAPGAPVERRDTRPNPPPRPRPERRAPIVEVIKPLPIVR